ncbi:MAG: hypothetical protein HXO38_10715 [Prevotella sp.]|uniref:hypothetical protein n=1 Tax=Prevotella sp. TaxID=59823 RepID=UPI001CABFE24|nr:hypothetical protein [Prevotella sp.]MBF1583419.1 hypothetical protein [Prevotella sp.]MBF1592939.1 hypothetical protein [Prevotella sp.]MBF1599765.1 hypothetical protein [Prevotella sp.]MBF1610283.1 hypothetical protein [Prevotella sp.]
MKKILSVLMLLLLSISIYAQQDVTKFLGIPVDGSKAAMIQKLKEKGFTYNTTTDFLEGVFNGEKVYIHIQTNKNKVWRIVVWNKTGRDEGQIKIRYNKLFQQFEDNSKYTISETSHKLSDSEDISYEISVNNKQYAAVFYQLPYEGAQNRIVWFTIAKEYGEYYIAIYYENDRNASHGEDL